MDILDNASVIAQRDSQDALGVIGQQWQQLSHDFGVQLAAAPIDNIVLAGMGGSALSGVLVATWPQATLPFEVCRQYDLPSYVGERTLCIISSYSGNTEETLSALHEAIERQAQVVVVSAGGQLSELAREKGLPLFVIPGGIQPRLCVYYFLHALADTLAQYGVSRGQPSELAAQAGWLQAAAEQWAPSVPTADNLAKQIAMQLVGKTVIIYGGPLMYPAANKWKIGLNENAKNLAWSGQYPEFDHNEFIGWSSHPVQKPFAVVELRTPLEGERIMRRYEVGERLLSGLRPAPIVVTPAGETPLQQLLWAITLGDMVSAYLAILNGVDPTPVALVEKLKAELR